MMLAYTFLFSVVLFLIHCFTSKRYKGRVSYIGIGLALLVQLIAEVILARSGNATLCFYNSVFFLVSLSAALATYHEGKYNVFLFISFGLLFFILGLRDASGMDDVSYISTFEFLKTGSVLDKWHESHSEIGYMVLNKITNAISSDYFFHQAVCSLIPLTIICCSIYDYRRISVFYICVVYFISFIYVQMLSVSLVRMFIAISIVFYAMRFLFTSQLKRYVAWVLFASFFHYSAASLLLFAPFAWRNGKYIFQYRIAISLILLECIAVIALAGVMALYVGGRYELYVSTGEMSFNIGQFSSLPFLLFGIYFLKKIGANHKKEYMICLYFTFVGIAMSCLSSIVPVGRVIFYFNLPTMFLFSLWYIESKSQLFRISLSLGVIAYAYLYLSVSQFGIEDHFEHLVPYRNIYFTI